MHAVSPGAALARPSLGDIFEEHFDYVWSSLRRLDVPPSDLEDQVQEVFLRVHAKLGDYDPQRPLRPWIFGFAFRVASDYRRLARHRFEIIGAEIEVVEPSAAADDRMAASEERAFVEAALLSVSLERRAVLLMHDVDDVPVPTIAATLGIPVNTAYSRLRVAREEFAAAWKRLLKKRGER